MDSERATRAISLVLISSLVVFAGWGAGDSISSMSEQAHPPGNSYTGGPYGGSYGGHFWYYPWGYRYGGGSGFRSGGGGRPGVGRSGQARPSVRGGFGSFGRGAGA